MRHESNGVAGAKAASPRLDALTGLRFVAAAHVMVFHCGLVQLPWVPVWAKNIAIHADMSVSLFFVLSGFILTYTYVDLHSGLRTSREKFWLARFARVYPIYLAGLLLSLPFFLNDGHGCNTTVEVVGKVEVAGLVLLLLQAWLPQTVMAWNFPSWSLSNEAFFYYCFPTLVALLRQQPRRFLFAVIALLWLVAQIPPILVQIMGPDGFGYLDVASIESWRLFVQANPLIRLMDFMIGILIGRLWLQEQAAQTTSQHSGAWLSVVALATMLVIMGWNESYPYPVSESRSLLAPLNALLIYGLVKGGGPLYWLLSQPLLILLGNASYALYLLHVPIAKGMQHIAGIFGNSSPYSWPFFLSTTSVVVGVSVTMFWWVEEPARRWLRQLAVGR